VLQLIGKFKVLHTKVEAWCESKLFSAHGLLLVDGKLYSNIYCNSWFVVLFRTSQI